MPAYIAVPVVTAISAILGILALGPAAWLTRSQRALKFRGIHGRTLALCWIVAALPWVIVGITIQVQKHVGFSADDVASLIVAIVAAIALFGALVSLPLSVVVLSVIWLLDRKPLKENVRTT